MNCPICGMEAKVVGHTTQHYEPELPSVDEISDVTIPLVDKNFPKGECKERGKAIVLHAEMLMAIHALLTEEVKP